jgi:hypothetical protein
MTTFDEVRAFALSLPEATSQDHHGMESFRVRGKIFATVPDEEHLRIMVSEEDIRAAVAEHPMSCSPFYWGNRLSCVVVRLDAADRAVVQELLADSWRRKAPKNLVDRLPEG